MSGTQPVTIMMIEDDAGHARLIEKTLQRAGIAVPLLRFDSGASALAFLFGDAAGVGDKAVALIMLDLNLPDMSGLAILARIRASPALLDTPVMVLTTTDDRLEMERCYELGCNGYMAKPVRQRDLTAALQGMGILPHLQLCEAAR